MSEQKKIDGGELCIRTLKQAGVKDIFALHGGHLDPIFQACLDHDIRLIDTRHEAAAGHAADAYARQTGNLGVALATAGPGFTNIITAITQAFLDCSPVLFIAGAPPLRDAERWPLQGGIDQIAMVKPVTKWARQITHTDQIPHILSQAIREATTGRPGPVLVEIPIDVLYSPVSEESVSIPAVADTSSASAPPGELVVRILKTLQTASNPVIVAGGGTLFSRASTELIRFAETTGIPVYTNNKAIGVMPTEHPLSGQSMSNLMVSRAMGGTDPDVALFLGARFGMFTLNGEILPKQCKLIQVDISGAEMGRNRPVDIPVIADCRETLRALNEQATKLDWPDWSTWSATVHQTAYWHTMAYQNAVQKSALLHPYQVMQEIMKNLDEDTIVCADGGETYQWADLVARARHPGQFTGHGYLGCLGIGMPFAIGSQLAHPDRRVVCIVGDGAAGLNIQEFDTMTRHDLPILTIILNNKAWGMCVHGQQAMFGDNRLVVTQLGDSRYEKVAEGFGCHGEYVDALDQVGPAVKRSLASGRPACINLITNIDAVFGDTSGDKIQKSAPKEGEVAMPYYGALNTD